jgi:hypothetical protein
LDVTAPAVAVKFAVVAAAGTATDAGTETVENALLANATVMPPLGAGLEIVTVQPVDVDPARLVELQVKDVTDIAVLIANVTDLFDAPRLAVSTGALSTAAAVTVKVALVPFAGTSADAGAASADGTLLAIVTAAPPTGAGAEMFTVQFVVAGPVNVVLAHDNELTVTPGVTVIDTDLALPFTPAVTTGFMLLVTAPAVAVNVADVAEAGTTTDAGTLSAELRLLTNATLTPAAGAGLEIVTVQVVLVEAISVLLPHASEETWTVATSEMLALAVPFRLALMFAVWSAVNEPAVTLKVAVLAFGAIETEDGAVILPVDVNATDPPAGKAPLIVTVQTDVPPGPSDEGAQLSPLIVGAGAVVTLIPPLVVLITNSAARDDAPYPSITPTGAEVAPLASVIDTLATTPFAIAPEFIPLATQM